MIHEIHAVEDDIAPFDSIQIYSPFEGKDAHTIALGKVLRYRDGTEPGTYSYIGPVEEPKRDSPKRTVGPIINHDAPLGDPNNIIHEIEFPQEGEVFVSESTYSFHGEKVYGVWDKVIVG